MTNALGGFPLLLLLLGLLGDRNKDLSRRSSAPPRPTRRPTPRLPPARTAPRLQQSTSRPAPWPQVVPRGLPKFPGPGWEPDEPPPRAVQQRAAQLLRMLWAHGEGSYKIEQVDGRWIAFRSHRMGTKKGVVAYRTKARNVPVPAASPTRTRAPSSARPTPMPPVDVTYRPPPRPVSPLSLPTLRYGMGLRPKAPDSNVKLAQARLGIADDGRFGKGTLKAIRDFQSAHGLVADGIVGPKTWGALFAS